MSAILPVGKLPPDLLAQLLARSPLDDERVLLGPSLGLDCAAVDHGGPNLLVCKSDPITFASDEIGWYLVQVNANDIAMTGALPRWLLVTMLLPEGSSTAESVMAISQQIYDACRPLDISVIGGHSEVTYGLERPIVIGTMIGEVAREQLVTPQGTRPGDRLLLTKGVPIEGTAILAREFAQRLSGMLTPVELAQAQGFLHDPGISVLKDAQIAMRAGKVTAMHDPTEGGLAAALWELAQASGRSLVVNVSSIPVPDLSARICQVFGLDPLATIASGALLLTAAAEDAAAIIRALVGEGIPCVAIGRVEEGPTAVWQETEQGLQILTWPERDEIGRAYEGEEG